MIREIKQVQIGFSDPRVIYKELAGTSLDNKPIDPVDADVVTATGSLFLEVDTGNVYAYDEEGAAWNQVCALGGDN